MSAQNHQHSRDRAAQHPHIEDTGASAAEPADVDALLAESLKAQSERDFTWKEPERRPRWWERAEAAGAVSQVSKEAAPGKPAARWGSVVFALISLILAGWVVATVAFGVTVSPLVVGLVICFAAGSCLIIAGLRPKPGTRL